MTAFSPQPQGGAPPRTVRRLVVEVVDARDLLPKDGQGSSSPYVVVEFDNQKKRTSTRHRDLNPTWNESLHFIVSDPSQMDYDELLLEVHNDRRYGPASRKSHFLGRVKVYGSQFAPRGQEGLVYFSLEKKSVFSWVRGEIGLKVYYYDEEVIDDGGAAEQLHQQHQQQQQQIGDEGRPPPVVAVEEEEEEEGRVFEIPPIGHPTPPLPSMMPAVGPGLRSHSPPPVVVIEEPAPPTQPPVTTFHSGYHHRHPPPPPETHAPTPGCGPPLPEGQFPSEAVAAAAAEARKMQGNGAGERARALRRPNGEFLPRVIPEDRRNSFRHQRFASQSDRFHPYDLVEPMLYLFVRICKARGLAQNESPYVKLRSSTHYVRSKPAVHRSGDQADVTEWNQVFALGHHKNESAATNTLEISVWESQYEKFLGGVCFDLSDVPMREPPDSPLAPQWYRLDGVAADDKNNRVCGDIQLSVWIGTQADDAFPEAWSSDAPSHVAHTRSKVYQSPKLWYLRVTVIEAQDLQITPNLPPLTAPDIRVKGQLGFQSVRTRRGSVSGHATAFHWNEDLIFVAGEPLEESLVILVEDRTTKETVLLGHILIPVSSIEQRMDERHVPAKWFALEGGTGGGALAPGAAGSGITYCGRMYMRLCLEGGYHVLDEAAHVCSDFRPTAKQLWKPAVGILELGILGARGLLPMKSKGPGKGSTDPYCVAKYGKKWVRTRTITDSFDPRWNEQYTWQVYDPCTVLTVAVFDNWRMFSDPSTEDRPDCRIGKIRIRVSTLESNRVYTNSYPLLVLSRIGLKKMGEIELAVRFACPSLLPETCVVYGQPLLPRMHYLRPLGVAQQEALRGAATRMVAAWLARSEPPLGPEVVRYMLDADSHAWSMRKSKANWFRIVSVLAWAIGLAKWLDDIRRWRNVLTTVLVHLLYLVLVWFPDLIVPTGCLYVFLIGVWYYRFRPRIPAGMDTRLSQAESVDPDELDEEFDTIPSSKPPDIIRARYDRLRMLAARVQTVLGDFATQGERVQALVSWRDPRATKLFIAVCLAVTITLYLVPPKMVAVALGFYYLRHPMFRDPMPPSSLNFFRRLPSLSDRLM
ncbi:hypothetical protein MLD38_027181 [Melastoma candidum]|uniref:Uncharacterized protein n=1 Tax=Melastoma candidum TaxID=119954 RepID=A0ACB9P0X5_9MYRT|nr:hypothetical protein MLD38_027181 [Melastoma candidum]